MHRKWNPFVLKPKFLISQTSSRLSTHLRRCQSRLLLLCLGLYRMTAAAIRTATATAAILMTLMVHQRWGIMMMRIHCHRSLEKTRVAKTMWLRSLMMMMRMFSGTCGKQTRDPRSFAKVPDSLSARNPVDLLIMVGRNGGPCPAARVGRFLAVRPRRPTVTAMKRPRRQRQQPQRQSLSSMAQQKPQPPQRVPPQRLQPLWQPHHAGVGELERCQTPMLMATS